MVRVLNELIGNQEVCLMSKSWDGGKELLIIGGIASSNRLASH